MQRGVIPIQKSSNKHIRKDNIDVFDFKSWDIIINKIHIIGFGNRFSDKI